MQLSPLSRLTSNASWWEGTTAGEHWWLHSSLCPLKEKHGNLFYALLGYKIFRDLFFLPPRICTSLINASECPI